MTPGCQLCGYAVDWLRSCYYSEWRLYDDPAVLTPGRYYFAAPGTPHYPRLHRYGSSVWTAGEERRGDITVGEVTASRRPYSRGALGVPQPPAVQLGSLECIQGGESVASLPSRVVLVGGIDVQCYVAGGVPVPPPQVLPARLRQQQRLYRAVVPQLPARLRQQQRLTASMPAAVQLRQQQRLTASMPAAVQLRQQQRLTASMPAAVQLRQQQRLTASMPG